MRIVFMGTPDFAQTCLAALIEAGHDIACVYSQPPRKSGRGHKTRPSPVQAFAEEQGLMVRHPLSLKDAEAQADFAALDADVAVVVAYGLILPQAILDAPKRGCINVHASLLPRWRGAAPIQRAIEAGDRETGVGIMQMEAGLDTGPVILERRLTIGDDESAASLHDRLAALGAQAVVEALALPSWNPQPQSADGVTYAHKLDKREALLDWQQPATLLARRIRAFNPVPGAYFTLGKERIKVLAAEPLDMQGPSGQALDDQLTIGCGQGALRLTQLQPAGKAAMDAKAFLNGRALPAGTVLLPPEA